MANAKMCDRCGILYEDRATADESFYASPSKSLDKSDLCAGCAKKLEEFINAVEWETKESKTYAEDLLFKFPDARIATDGYPWACAKDLYKNIRCKGLSGCNCVNCWQQIMPKTEEAAQ